MRPLRPIFKGGGGEYFRSNRQIDLLQAAGLAGFGEIQSAGLDLPQVLIVFAAQGEWRGEMGEREGARASAVSRKWLDRMKPLDFFARQGATLRPYWTYGKGLQRSMAEKDAVSCRVICETPH